MESLDFLAVQWLRIHRPKQGTQVQSLVGNMTLAVQQLSQDTTTTESAL